MRAALAWVWAEDHVWECGCGSEKQQLSSIGCFPLLLSDHTDGEKRGKERLKNSEPSDSAVIGGKHRRCPSPYPIILSSCLTFCPVSSLLVLLSVLLPYFMSP